MNRIYKTTYADWYFQEVPPDPQPPEIAGAETTLDGYETLVIAEDLFRTVWTWDCYIIEKEELGGGMVRMTRAAPSEQDEPQIDDSKSGKLIRADVSRDGDRVVLDMSLEVDATSLRQSLTGIETYLQMAPPNRSWRGPVEDFLVKIKTTIDGASA